MNVNIKNKNKKQNNVKLDKYLEGLIENNKNQAADITVDDKLKILTNIVDQSKYINPIFEQFKDLNFNNKLELQQYRLQLKEKLKGVNRCVVPRCNKKCNKAHKESELSKLPHDVILYYFAQLNTCSKLINYIVTGVYSDSLRHKDITDQL